MHLLEIVDWTYVFFVFVLQMKFALNSQFTIDDLIMFYAISKCCDSRKGLAKDCLD